MKIAVLAVQGAFAEQEQIFHKLGVETVQLRQAEDVKKKYDALVLPGGESTVQGKLIRELGMFDTLQTQIMEGLPVMATCAGLILLAEQLTNDSQVHLQTLPVSVCRNGYGRQLGSFSKQEYIQGIGDFPMRFIRAPYITRVGGDTQVLARVQERIVMVRYQNQLAMAFHPELTEDMRVHAYFLEMVKERNIFLHMGKQHMQE